MILLKIKLERTIGFLVCALEGLKHKKAPTFVEAFYSVSFALYLNRIDN